MTDLQVRILALLLTLALTYAGAWLLASWIDEGICIEAGIPYAGTRADLRGYCRVSGVDVPAEAVYYALPSTRGVK